MDSKLLIDFCAKAGILVKNSALASISPEEKETVLGLIRSSQSSPAATVAPKAALVPARDPAAEMKSRPIKTMTSRGSVPMKARGDQFDEAEAEMLAEVAEAPPLVADEPPAPAEPAPVVAPTPMAEMRPVVQPPRVIRSLDNPNRSSGGSARSTAPAPASGPALAAPPPVPAAPAPPQPISPLPEQPIPTEIPEPEELPPAQSGKQAPLTRGDYVAPGRPGRAITLMQSRPTGGDLAGARKGDRRNAAPLVAPVPEYQPKIAKGTRPEDQKAQKPEITFTQEVIREVQSNPLKRFVDKVVKRVEEEAGEAARKERSKKGAVPGAAGLEESRTQRREERKSRHRVDEEEETDAGHRSRRGIRVKRGPQPVALKSTAEIESPITVRSLSEAIGRPANRILAIMMQRGTPLKINDELEEELAIELAMELGVDLEVLHEKDIDEQLIEESEAEDRPEDMVERPVIVTILGHVDHGKTTLVDTLRSANVAASEHGGITQHIAAYQIDHHGKRLTFVDTPGHAAFGEMRARGANVTDVIVLVVAANDGVMPQTVECIAHAKAAGVPLIVAMNKMDLPETNEQRVLQDLAQHNVLASEWGGDVEVVRTSGLTGQGLPDLLDTILLTAELHEYKANPNRPAAGVCLEAFRDEGRGPVAWLIVRRGTLRVGDVILCGEAMGRVRAIFSEWDQELQEAGPSTPCKVAGLDAVPNAGDAFHVVDSLEAARAAADLRAERSRQASLSSRGGRRTMEDLLNAAQGGQVSNLPLILKADSPGSLEALRSELQKFSHPEVRVQLLHQGIGGVNESDVYLASASNAVIVAFHVIAEDRAELLAQQEGVDIRRYNIIYEVVDEIRRNLEGLLKPEQKEVVTGRAIVLRTFSITRFGTIAGCRVLNGTIERSSRVHLIREQKILNNYSIASLKREKDDAKEVREGMECGIRLEGFNDVKEGDLLEAFKIEEIKRTLD